MLTLFFNKIPFFLFCAFFLCSNALFSQLVWASSVYDYQFGGGQTIGQSSNYFPNNVLGAVSANVSATTPASLPNEVLSLGRNGWVSVGFDVPIIDGPGADFTIFENAFEIAGGLGIFDEWLIVSVSNDGQNWFTFPYDSLTGAGMAGRTPTQGGNINYLNPLQSGGDSFDIGELGLSQIQYVRVQDATRFQSEDKISAELDAIIALHQITTEIDADNKSSYQIYVSENKCYILSEIPLQIDFFSFDGRLIQNMKYDAMTKSTISLENLAKGAYFLSVNGNKKSKFVLY